MSRLVVLILGSWVLAALMAMMGAGADKGVWFFGGICFGIIAAVLIVSLTGEDHAS